MSERSYPIPLKAVLAMHEDQIERNGGLPGVRDVGLLESALAQPFESFDGNDLYPSIIEKAARYAYGIIRNHPFADGNKRTGVALVFAFLRANEVRFKPRSTAFYAMIVAVADGTASYGDLVSWIEREVG